MKKSKSVWQLKIEMLTRINDGLKQKIDELEIELHDCKQDLEDTEAELTSAQNDLDETHD